MEPDPCRKLGPRHRMPALSGAEREGGNFKRRPRVRQASNPAWLNRVPAKSSFFLEPQKGTLFGNRTIADVIGWAFNQIELVLLDEKREQTQVTEGRRPREGGDRGWRDASTSWNPTGLLAAPRSWKRRVQPSPTGPTCLPSMQGFWPLEL